MSDHMAKICPTCKKKFEISPAIWSEELIEIMNRQFKNHIYYCKVEVVRDELFITRIVKKLNANE
jgi:hypothetical protein